MSVRERFNCKTRIRCLCQCCLITAIWLNWTRISLPVRSMRGLARVVVLAVEENAFLFLPKRCGYHLQERVQAKEFLPLCIRFQNRLQSNLCHSQRRCTSLCLEINPSQKRKALLLSAASAASLIQTRDITRVFGTELQQMPCWHFLEYY